MTNACVRPFGSKKFRLKVINSLSITRPLSKTRLLMPNRSLGAILAGLALLGQAHAQQVIVATDQVQSAPKKAIPVHPAASSQSTIQENSPAANEALVKSRQNIAK